MREKRQLNQRKDGLMRKAKDCQKLCRVKITIIFEDECDGKTDIFRTEDGFPSGFNIKVCVIYTIVLLI